MSKTKSTAVVTVASEEQLALLRGEFPQEQGYKRNILPKLGMFSQDQMEGKGKSMKVVTEAGTFYIEHETEDLDENGKKIWVKDEIGTEIEASIIFSRKQLKYYNENDETFTSSAIYDNDDEVISLWCSKAEIAKGTPAELKARPEYEFEEDGKKKSRLKDNRILYVLYEGELYQMNIGGSSMYSWMTFLRKIGSPTSSLLKLSSEPKEKGKIAWNQMVFEVVRSINSDEANKVIELITDLKNGILAEKSFFASQVSTGEKSNIDKF